VSLREDDVATLQATLAGSIMGTPAYMSPEQILGDIREIDARADIWSLGVVLYELCTLKLPFEGKDLAELAAHITTTDPPDPTTVNPQRRVPPELRDIILGCLKRDKSQRYASVAELLADIENWLEGVAPWRLVKDVDFSRMPDGKPEGWTCVKGRWRVSEGVLRSEDVRDNVLLLDEDVVGDVRVEAEAQVIEGFVDAEITIALSVPMQEVPGRWEEGYSIQFGTHGNSTATFQRKAIEVAGVAASRTPGQWHRVVAEKVGDLVRLSVDGREILRWRDLAPLSGSQVGLYTTLGGLRVRRFRLFSRGYPLTVSCLAVPDAFYEKGMVQDAKVAYLEVAENHPAREEGLHALFRAGKCNLTLALSAEDDRATQKQVLDEATALFDRVERSPLGPLACLGKSLVHEFRGEVEKEADELTRAHQDYPGCEGLAAVGERLWERLVSFRLDGERIRSALFGMPALRFHPGAMSSGLTFPCVNILPDVTLTMERLTDYIRTSPSAHHQELARHALVSNCLWNGRWDRAEREIHERVANSEGPALYNALAELARLRGRQRRYEEALSVYQRIESEWPADRERLFYALSNAASVCGICLGRYDEAEERARRIFAEWPASGVQLASVHYIYGWTLFLQER